MLANISCGSTLQAFMSWKQNIYNGVAVIQMNLHWKTDIQ